MWLRATVDVPHPFWRWWVGEKNYKRGSCAWTAWELQAGHPCSSSVQEASQYAEKAMGLIFSSRREEDDSLASLSLTQSWEIPLFPSIMRVQFCAMLVVAICTVLETSSSPCESVTQANEIFYTLALANLRETKWAKERPNLLMLKDKRKCYRMMVLRT